MSIVLSHISALEFWRSAASDAGPPCAACALRDAPACAPPPASSSERVLLSCGTFSAPLHVLALDGRRKSTPHFVVHQARSLPSSSFRAIALEGAEEPLFVACPELAFAHLAASLSFARAVHLGYELCGTYAPDDSRPFGVRNRSPLATPDSIAAYLDQTWAVRGAGPARVALPHVLALSASPRESTLSMLLTLPYARGGSNIAHPRMTAVSPSASATGGPPTDPISAATCCGPSKTSPSSTTARSATRARRASPPTPPGATRSNPSG